MSSAAADHTGQPKGTIGAPSVWEILPAALLATVGGLGIFVPLAIVAVLSGLTSEQPEGPAILQGLFRAATLVPALYVAALVASIALYRQAQWARRLARIVSVLLMAAPFVWVAGSALGLFRVGADGTLPDGTIGLRFLLYQAFLIAEPTLGVVAAGAIVGAITFWGIREAARGATNAAAAADPGTPRPAARRPDLAMVLLVFVGVDALVPYLAWILTGGVASQASAHGGVVDGTSGANVVTGVMLAIPTAMASIGALAAARAIRARAPYGPYLAPAAAAIAGPWSAVWLGGLIGSVLGTGDEGTLDAVLLVPRLLLLAAVAIVALAFFPVTASVMRRRGWFLDRRTWRTRGAQRHRVGRFWPVTAGLALVLSLPLALGTFNLAVNPPPLQLRFGEVLLDGQPYDFAAPVSVDVQELASAGRLSAWASDLAIEDPEAYALSGFSPELAVVVVGSPLGTSVQASLFVPRQDLTGQWRSIPAELCPLVELEEADVFVEPCGPPGQIILAGVVYDVVVGSGFVLRPADLGEPAGIASADQAPSDERVSLAARAIDNVPSEEAVVLMVGNRIVLYRALVTDGLPISGELCRYSPSALENPLSEEKFGGAPVPEGCTFPYSVAFESRIYERDPRLTDLLDIPTSALTRIGVAQSADSGMPENGQPVLTPFPVTIDAAVYRIDGVSPERAIAFVIGTHQVVALAGDSADPIPAELCPYVSSSAAAELEAQGYEPLGCP